MYHKNSKMKFLWYHDSVKMIVFCDYDTFNLNPARCICHKFEIADHILEDWELKTHLKKDKVMCDSFEIECIEETSLHAYFNTSY